MTIRISLIDPFNTKSTFLSERRNISLDCVENSFAVVALSERRHKPVALDLSDHSVRQVTLDVTTHLREVLAILNCDH